MRYRPLCSCQPAGEDLLLSFISTRLGNLQQSSATPHSASVLEPSGSGPSSLSPDVQQWEVQWDDIRIERPVGRGSYGKVGHHDLKKVNKKAKKTKQSMRTEACRGLATLQPLALSILLHCAGVPGPLECDSRRRGGYHVGLGRVEAETHRELCSLCHAQLSSAFPVVRLSPLACAANAYHLAAVPSCCRRKC